MHDRGRKRLHLVPTLRVGTRDCGQLVEFREESRHFPLETAGPVQGGIPQWKTKSVNGADLVAVADVYEPHRNQAAARAGPKTAKFHDYRKLLDQKDVQAVIIAAPDHWHKQMLVDAVAAGKDVYLEKPVTHTLEEGPEE